MHCMVLSIVIFAFFFFFNDTATTEIYTYGHTLSLHDALPIYRQTEDQVVVGGVGAEPAEGRPVVGRGRSRGVQHLRQTMRRSEEHTSELQSLMRISYAVFCLKKKNIRKTQ